MAVGAILKAGVQILGGLGKAGAGKLPALLAKLPGPVRSFLTKLLGRGSTGAGKLAANLSNNATPAGRRALQFLRGRGVDIGLRREVAGDVMRSVRWGGNQATRLSTTLGNWANAIPS